MAAHLHDHRQDGHNHDMTKTLGARPVEGVFGVMWAVPVDHVVLKFMRRRLGCLLICREVDFGLVIARELHHSAGCTRWVNEEELWSKDELCAFVLIENAPSGR